MRFAAIVASVCGVILLTGGALTGSSMYVSRAFETNRDASATLLRSMRQQMLAVMLHDSMRGIVYRALYAATAGDAAIATATRQEIIDYADTFTEAIAAQTALTLPADIGRMYSIDASPQDDRVT